MDLADIMLVVFGIAMLYAPIEIGRDYRRMKARVASTQGLVVGHVTKSGSGWSSGGGSRHRACTQHARILYEVNGASFECTSSFGASWKLQSEGDMVDVRYDPDDPANGDVATGPWMHLLYKVLLFGFPVAGVITLVIAGMRFLG